MYLLARFWNTLRLEDVDVHKGADGTIFSMDQYRCAACFLQWFVALFFYLLDGVL